MRILLLAVLALTAVPLLAASRVVGPEIAVAAPSLLPADRVSGGGAADSNGSMALVVWQERRAANESDIFAARIDADGNILDPGGIQVTATPESEEAPHTVWDGEAFVVAWAVVDPTPTNYARRSVWFTRITEDGSLAQPAVNVADGYLDDIQASGGVTALLIHSGNFYTTGQLTAYLLAPGRKVAQATLASSANGGLLARTPAGFIAVWQTRNGSQIEIRAARFLRDASIEEAATLVASSPDSTVRNYAVAARGDEGFVAVGGSAFRLVRLPRGGAVETIATLPSSGVTLFVWALMVSADGFTTAVYSDPESSLWRLSPAGTLMQSTTIEPSPARSTVLTPLGGRTYIISSANASGSLNIYGGFDDDAAAPQIISRTAETQQAPAIASDGERLLIVWDELHASNTYSIKGVIASLDGTPLADPFEIFPNGYYGGWFAVTFDGTEYVVVREQDLHFETETGYLGLVVATHVSRDGSPRGDRIVIPTTAIVNAEARPSLASDGRNVLIAWSDRYYLGRFALLTPTGLTQPVDLGAACCGANPFSVAWNGSTFAVAVTAGSRLLVARIAPDGTLVGSTLIAVTMPPGLGPISNASIASNGDGFLVSYIQNRMIGANSYILTIEALPLDRNAQPAGPPVSSPTNLPVSGPRLTWDGASYEMAWTERGTTSSFSDAYAMFLSPKGEPRNLSTTLRHLGPFN